MNPVDGFLLADFTIGYWYIIHGVYTFGCSMLAIFMLVWFFGVTKKEYLKADPYFASGDVTANHDIFYLFIRRDTSSY
ncbi:hypothetical protein ACEQPO_25125 [Bacillus sp. SL00103]